MPVNYRIIENRKYMWDGRQYENETEALNAAAAYQKDKFDVKLAQEDGKHLVYTRREAASAAPQQ